MFVTFKKLIVGLSPINIVYSYGFMG